MKEQYIDLIKAFKELDIEDKKGEILKKVYELIKLYYLENKKIDNFNESLGLLSEYSDDDSYYNLLFLYIMILREESAELIGKIEEII